MRVSSVIALDMPSSRFDFFFFRPILFGLEKGGIEKKTRCVPQFLFCCMRASGNDYYDGKNKAFRRKKSLINNSGLWVTI